MKSALKQISTSVPFSKSIIVLCSLYTDNLLCRLISRRVFHILCRGSWVNQSSGRQWWARLKSTSRVRIVAVKEHIIARGADRSMRLAQRVLGEVSFLPLIANG